MIKKELDVILYIFIGLAIILSIVNFSLISARSYKVNEAILLAEKENQPAKIELIKITASSCPDCFNVDSVIESLRKSNVNVTSERSVDFSSQEANQLIEQYKIEKLPTVIVLGEVNESTIVSQWNQDWQVEIKDGREVSVVYSAVTTPYVDINGNIKGLVSLTHIIDQACSDCADLSQVISFFEKQNVKFSTKRTIDYTSSDARDLIANLGVQKIPAMIISKDILDYKDISEVWDQLNATEKNGFYALHTIAPPYRDLAKNKIEGLVTVIYLNDSTCTNCYDVQVNKRIIERNLGLVISNGTFVDISSDAGKKLIKQHNITKVPIMLASPEANLYTLFVHVWPQVGTLENDGWYVMRKPEVLGTYKDLETGQVVQNEETSG